MTHRFFIDTPISSDQAVMTGSESHHFQHVMRGSVGDQVTLFNGSGQEFTARVERIGRAEVLLSVTEARHVNRESPRRLVLGVSLPKGDRQRWLIEKAVELGVTSIIPLKTQRSLVHPDTRALGKLKRSIVESSKQCGRNRLMEIAETISFEQFLQMPCPAATRWLAHPGSGQFSDEPPINSEVYMAVGPEGGFTCDEVGAAERAGWQTMGLGPRILRVETACLTMAVLASR